MDKVYEYQYWLTYLADGSFDKDQQLRKWLDEGYKPLREVNVANTGYILLVLSRPKV